MKYKTLQELKNKEVKQLDDLLLNDYMKIQMLAKNYIGSDIADILNESDRRKFFMRRYKQSIGSIDELKKIADILGFDVNEAMQLKIKESDE